MTTIFQPTLLYLLIAIISYAISKKRENYNRVAYSERQQLVFLIVFIIGCIFCEVLYNILVGAGWIKESIVIINVSRTMFFYTYSLILIAIFLPIVSWGRKASEVDVPCQEA